MSKLIYTLLLVLSSFLLWSQEMYLDLATALELADGKSIESLTAQYQQDKAGLTLDIVRSQLRPQLRLSAQLPGYESSSIGVTQPDGSIAFQNVSQNLSQASLYLSQTILSTNTELYAESNLVRFDNLTSDLTNYNSNPIRVGIRQPIRGFNSLRWDKKLAEQDMIIQSKDKIRRNLANKVSVANAFFSLLTSQTDVTIATTNMTSSEEIFRIAKERFALGKITEDDLLQIELSVNNSKRDLSSARRQLVEARFALVKEMNRFDISDSLILDIPNELAAVTVDPQMAAELAWQNHPIHDENERALTENDRNIDFIKKNNGFRANLDASIGLVSSNNNFGDLYSQLNDESLVRLGLSIPLFDGKLRKNLLRDAQLDRDLLEQTTLHNEASLKQSVHQLSQQINWLQGESQLAYDNYQIAQKRYDIANQRYALGNISNTDLSIAFAERDAALRNYILTLRDYWINYYDLQSLTLYDFEKQEPITQ